MGLGVEEAEQALRLQLDELLEGESREIDDFIVSLDGTIASVDGTYERIAKRFGEIAVGGPRVPSETTGQITKVIIGMHAQELEDVVNIQFFGQPPIEMDDQIRAYVFRGTYRVPATRDRRVPGSRPSPIYRDAEWHEMPPVLQAFKIEKIHPSGVVAATWNNPYDHTRLRGD